MAKTLNIHTHAHLPRSYFATEPKSTLTADKFHATRKQSNQTQSKNSILVDSAHKQTHTRQGKNLEKVRKKRHIQIQIKEVDNFQIKINDEIRERDIDTANDLRYQRDSK